MRKVSLTIVLIGILLLPTYALGFDANGIWGNFDLIDTTVFQGIEIPEVVFMVRENRGIVVVAEIWVDEWESFLSWNAYMGNKSGNTVNINSVRSTVIFNATITLHSDTSATLRVNNCTFFIEDCFFPTGTVIPLQKIL